MNRLVIAARLLPDTHDQAEALLRKGPPFEPGTIGLHLHGAYLTASEVVFVFEAPEVEWIVSDIGNDPILSTALRTVAGDLSTGRRGSRTSSTSGRATRRRRPRPWT